MRWEALSCVAVAGALALPSLAEAAPRGGSQIQVSIGAAPTFLFSGATYLPLAGTPLQVQVSATGARGRRLLRRRLRVRYRYGGRCARSFAAARGRSLPMSAGRNSQGFRVYRSALRQFRASSRLRVCLWFARSRRARVGAVRRTLKMRRQLYGGAMAYTGRFGLNLPDSPNLVSSAAATKLFRQTRAGPCPVDGETARSTFSSNFNGLWGAPISYAAFPAQCAGPLSISFGGPALPARRLSYTTTDYRGSRPVKSFGDCFTAAAQNRDVAQARAYLRAVGCRPGKVIRRNAPTRRRSGEVFSFEVAGGRAALVPRGTRIDMVVQP